ncbi:MAG TPA: anti-sigma factor [Rubrivivax sp.]|nr:anti-sigma factor [Rubrivivax sp.]HPO18676.1 anti-sigma factor [Rubrivivax sp.]
MSEVSERVDDDELHAFVDAQIDAARLPAVLAWLQAHPDAAARVLQWQAQRLQLRQLARSIDVGDTPAALTDAVALAAARARRRTRRTLWPQAAAVLLLVAAALAGGRYWERWAAADAPAALAASPAFVHDAVLAHAVYVPDKRHPVEVGASDEAHLVQWLSRRLGSPLKVPSLARYGYRLLGGRLLPGEGTPRAQFMYENAQGSRVTLYVAVFEPGQAPDAAAFRSVRTGGEESFFWVEDRFGYALSGNAGGPDMQALAREVHGQLAR